MDSTKVEQFSPLLVFDYFSSSLGHRHGAMRFRHVTVRWAYMTLVKSLRLSLLRTYCCFCRRPESLRFSKKERCQGWRDKCSQLHPTVFLKERDFVIGDFTHCHFWTPLRIHKILLTAIREE